METVTTPRAVDLQRILAAIDPRPALAELCAEAPIFKVGPRQFAVTRHADVTRLLKDRRAGHHVPRADLEAYFGKGPRADFQFNSIINRDPPDHTRLRRLMSQAFSRSLVLQLRPWITDLVDELLAPLRDGARFDVVDDLAFPLPTQVICELLGIASVDRAAIRDRVSGLTSLDTAVRDDALVWLREYIGTALSERRPDGDGDLLQRMLAAEDGDGGLTRTEIVDNAALLFFAGFETTKHLIAAGCSALITHPDQQRLLWNDPSLSPQAVEEILRYDTAVAFVVVYVHEPIDIGGFVVREGGVLHLLLGAANHDPAVFDDPASFVITRDPNPHLGFGGGLHLCLGAMLARLEGDIALRRLAEFTPGIVPAGDVVRSRSGLGSFISVPILSAAPRTRC